jgi:hypothetical protein
VSIEEGAYDLEKPAGGSLRGAQDQRVQMSTKPGLGAILQTDATGPGGPEALDQEAPQCFLIPLKDRFEIGADGDTPGDSIPYGNRKEKLEIDAGPMPGRQTFQQGLQADLHCLRRAIPEIYIVDQDQNALKSGYPGGLESDLGIGRQGETGFRIKAKGFQERAGFRGKAKRAHNGSSQSRPSQRIAHRMLRRRIPKEAGDHPGDGRSSRQQGVEERRFRLRA